MVRTPCSSSLLGSSSPSASSSFEKNCHNNPQIRWKSTHVAAADNNDDEGPVAAPTTSSDNDAAAGSYHRQSLNRDGDVPSRTQEVVRFPCSATASSSAAAVVHQEETTPVLLNAREHAVGYLSKILNARVYDAAIETELQEAKNLSAVSVVACAVLRALRRPGRLRACAACENHRS